MLNHRPTLRRSKRNGRRYEHFKTFLASQASTLADQVARLYREAGRSAKFAKAAPDVAAVDYDGTIINHAGHFTDPTDTAGAPVDGAFEFLHMLIENGFKAIVFSARLANDDGSIEAAMRSWFLEEGFAPDDLDRLEFTAVKPKGAKFFLDDRGIRFEGPAGRRSSNCATRCRGTKRVEKSRDRPPLAIHRTVATLGRAATECQFAGFLALNSCCKGGTGRL